ncbi:PAS domain-containing protein [Fulvivirga sediminis]|uniref:PAS domain-containing protein n=1 Tax=Fulvivirga sediminis TaxID=2803949 RepID=A0A937F9G2_9BACT|nr:PAS domain-containing protein [Fulvivirga sediminis]MBL3656458.1 PAS domain-containing protein [Fulvivirga sediminis]
MAVFNFFLVDHYQKNLLEDTEQINSLRKLQTLTTRLKRESQAYVDGDLLIKPKIESTYNGISNTIAELNIASLEEEIIDDDAFVSDSVDYELMSLQGLKFELHKKWDHIQPHIENLLFEPLSRDTVVEEIKQIPLNDSLNTYTTETSKKILSISNSRLQKSNNYIKKTSDKIISLTDTIIYKEKEAKKEDHSDLTFVLFVFLLLFSAAIIFIYLYVRKQVLEPLNELRQATEKVSSGELAETDLAANKNEVGEIASHINKIIGNLKTATNFVKNIEEGKLDSTFENINEEELNEESLEKALLTMREQMKKVEVADKERKWTSEGLAKFVDILRTTDDSVSKLGDIIISNLVKYTNSNQGGLYIINDDNTNNIKLELVSLFAFDTKKYDHKSYRIGEGLVGQTYQERETIYLLEIPHDYISITSGLGGANPRAILLVPLKINEEIYGVIELASFQEYEQYEIDFVEKLGESIASTISTVKNNQRTKILLEDSQALTEQMRSQEEEMRQNMEELQATQEQLTRQMNENNQMQEDLLKEKALLDALLNNLPDYIYFKDTESRFIRISKSMEKLFPYPLDEMIGKSDFDFQQKEAAQKFYDEEQEIMNKGIGYTNEMVHEVMTNGTDQWVITTKLPFYDKDGNCMGTFGTSKDITDIRDQIESSVSQKAPDITEIEEALNQQMEELKITQEQLDSKLIMSETSLKAFDAISNIIIINSEEKISYANENALKSLDLKKIELINQGIDTLLDKSVLTNIERDQILTKSLTFKPNRSTKLVNIYADISKNYIHLIWI